MDYVYLYNKHCTAPSPTSCGPVARAHRLGSAKLEGPDEGIWEVRGGKRAWVSNSCWVAVDRALRLADKRSFPARPDAAAEVREHDLRRDHEPVQPKAQGFVQSTGAGPGRFALMMPLVMFVSPTDRGCCRRSKHKPLGGGGGLVANSSSTGTTWRTRRRLPATRARSTSAPSGWWRRSRDRGDAPAQNRAEARMVFEQMLGYANHLGLLRGGDGAERRGDGNFPQAFTPPASSARGQPHRRRPAAGTLGLPRSRE